VDAAPDIVDRDDTRQALAIPVFRTRDLVHQMLGFWLRFEGREPFNIDQIFWNYDAGGEDLLDPFLWN
jgi:hypothetical protein